MLINGKYSTLQYPSSEKISSEKETEHQNNSDKDLWSAFINGDEAAFIHLYTQYANLLYSYGCQFTPDKEMVKDCLQDFFIYLRKNRNGFGNTPHIKMYLFKAFKRRVIDYLKKHHKECQKNEAFLFFQFPVELSSEAIYINRQLEDEQIYRLNKALKALDSKEREAIYYFYYEGLGYSQIAEIFDFSHVSSARRLIYRGLGQLRKHILICYLIMGWPLYLLMN